MFSCSYTHSGVFSSPFFFILFPFFLCVEPSPYLLASFIIFPHFPISLQLSLCHSPILVPLLWFTLAFLRLSVCYVRLPPSRAHCFSFSLSFSHPVFLSKLSLFSPFPPSLLTPFPPSRSLSSLYSSCVLISSFRLCTRNWKPESF